MQLLHLRRDVACCVADGNARAGEPIARELACRPDDADGGHGDALGRQNRRADRANAELVFLVVDRVALPADLLDCGAVGFLPKESVDAIALAAMIPTG